MKLFTTGSCFADQLGGKLKESRFRATVNPFGVSYNPVSIHKALSMALRKDRPQPELYAQSEGSFRHHDFHSSFRSKTLSQLTGLLNQTIADAGTSLQQADILMITYGTSWVFRHKDSGHLVNNCHKLPAKEFHRLLLDPDDIVASFDNIYDDLRKLSPSTRIILTVSPVRHLKDAPDLNQVSKAGLILACHRIVQQFKLVEYFPAYEIMMDDLRDYRFYDSDMIHPSAAAVDYIWQKFGERYFAPETAMIAARCQEISRALAHRPFDSASADYQAFLTRTLKLANELRGEADVTNDIRVLESRLTGS